MSDYPGQEFFHEHNANIKRAELTEQIEYIKQRVRPEWVQELILSLGELGKSLGAINTNLCTLNESVAEVRRHQIQNVHDLLGLFNEGIKRIEKQIASLERTVVVWASETKGIAEAQRNLVGQVDFLGMAQGAGAQYFDAMLSTIEETVHNLLDKPSIAANPASATESGAQAGEKVMDQIAMQAKLVEAYNRGFHAGAATKQESRASSKPRKVRGGCQKI